MVSNYIVQALAILGILAVLEILAGVTFLIAVPQMPIASTHCDIISLRFIHIFHLKVNNNQNKRN